MRILMQSFSILALLMTIVPAALFMSGSINLERAQTLMLIATVFWFVFTPMWMGRKTKCECDACDE